MEDIERFKKSKELFFDQKDKNVDSFKDFFENFNETSTLFDGVNRIGNIDLIDLIYKNNEICN